MGVAVVLEKLGILQVVERCASDGAGRELEAGGMDDVQPDAETSPEPEQGASVLRDVGLVEREFDSQDR
jgi:hypothetical protein